MHALHTTPKEYEAVIKKYADPGIIRQAMGLLVLKEPYVVQTEKEGLVTTYTVEGITVGTSSEIPSDIVQLYKVSWETGKIISIEFRTSFIEAVKAMPPIIFRIKGVVDFTDADKEINMAKKIVDKVIVIYGGKFCYVNPDEPTCTMQTIVEEQGPEVVRIQATHCVDMLAGEAERKKIAVDAAGGEKVWWMTPGWVKFRRHVFKDWDKGLANENFPRHTGGAIVLDGI